MEPWLEEHHRMLCRAQSVSTFVRDLWGDEPPPAADPALTAATDALAADDGFGRAKRVVVQGDQLTYQQLGAVLALIDDPTHLTQALTLLPPYLRRRLVDADRLTPAHDRRTGDDSGVTGVTD